MESNQEANKNATMAFNKQSILFDEIYNQNIIIEYKRKRTREHLEKQLKNQSQILELNAGTGEDAIYFAQKEHFVHSTDISEGMLSQLEKKTRKLNLSKFITYEQVSFNHLSKLVEKGPYGAIFSNFGGLNCTNNLSNVLDSFAGLLISGGTVTLIIMPSFCLWESLTMIKGNFQLAFRRFLAKNGARAHIEGIHFLCWYYQPSYIINHLKKDFKLVSLEGLCTLVPPSYFEGFPKKHPKLFSWLVKLEDLLKSTFPFKYIGDYYIITLKKIN